MGNLTTMNPEHIITNMGYHRLGVGDTILASDLATWPDNPEKLVAVGNEYVGQYVLDSHEPTFWRLRKGDAAYGAIGDDINIIAHQYGIETEMGRRALRIALANIQTLDRKQRDYGSSNIAAFGEYGVMVRVWDKVSRLRNLLQNVKDPANESVEDTWLDLANYAIIGLMCRRGEWR